MLTRVILTFCAVLLAQLKDVNCTSESFVKYLSRLHVQVSTTKLPPSRNPPPPRVMESAFGFHDRTATEKLTALVNYAKSLPKFNPFKGDIFGPYDASIPTLHFHSANLTFENVVVTGIENLRLQGLNMRILQEPSRIEFNASIPNISIEGDFDLDGISDNLPIHDRGHFEITLLDLVVSAVFGLKYGQIHSGRVFQIETTVTVIDSEDVQVLFETKYGKEIDLILGKFFNNSEDLSIYNDLLDLMLKAINQELEEIPAKKVLNELYGSKPLGPTMEHWKSNMRKSDRRYGK